jgi:uncharacterized protein YkwD
LTRARNLMICTVLACSLLLSVGVAEAMSPCTLMVRKINHFRHAHHLRSLHSSRLLSRSSAAYARRMIKYDTFRHSRGGKARRHYRRFGEVIAYHSGSGSYVNWTLRAWAHSSGHRAVLLDRRVRSIGAGKATGRFGRRTATVWVVQVGRR